MFQVSEWTYIQQTPITGKIEMDIANFLNANDRAATARHCAAVAKTCADLAARFGLDQTTASSCAFLHDISNVMKPQDMLRYALQCNWCIDNAEKKHPFLLHQRISAVFAKEIFGVDNTVVLSAITCHTTLKSNPSDYDMLLFLADKLSWDQEGVPPFYDDLCKALEQSLAYASLVYINFALDHGMILLPHQWLVDAKRWLKMAAAF